MILSKRKDSALPAEVPKFYVKLSFADSLAIIMIITIEDLVQNPTEQLPAACNIQSAMLQEDSEPF